MSENHNDNINTEKEKGSLNDKKSKETKKLKEEIHKVFNSKILDPFSINTENEPKDIHDIFLQQAYFIQLFEDLKASAPEFLRPWTLQSFTDKYDFCLFNLVWKWKTDVWGTEWSTWLIWWINWLNYPPPWSWERCKLFCLNDFFNYIETIKNDKQRGLIKFIFSMYCNNFIEFREFYHDKIYNSEIDNSMIQSMINQKVHPSDKITLYDIRCWLAHDVSFDKDKKSWKWLIHINVGNRNGEKQVDIEPSFFDEVLRLPSTYSNLDFDAIERWKNRKIKNYYTFKHRGISDTNKPINNMVNDSEFKQAQLEKIFNKKLYKKIKKDKVEIKNMKNLITSQGLDVSWYTLWLVSDTNRPYVHNLLSIVAINVYYQMLKNPSISYENLVNMTVKSLSNNLFTLQNTKNIITLCLDNINNWMKVQLLKTFYINIFKKDWELSSEKRKNETKEFLAKTDSNKIGEKYNEYINEMRHIRNALAHWRYFVIWDCIKMWDINKKDEVVRGSTMDSKFKNDKNEWVFSIQSLYEQTLDQELKFENKENRTIIETSNKLRKNIL